MIRDLSVFAVVEQSTLSRSLNALEKDGMIRREVDEKDTRATRIYLTEAGRTAFEQFCPAWLWRTRKCSGYRKGYRAVFLRTLKKMLINVRRHEI